jgi:16S rRNA (guanine527-N7)-methyltransferase
VTLLPNWPELDESLHARLLSGIEESGFAVSGAAVDSLLSYLALLSRWNRTYNLTAVRDPQQMVERHLLDSLVVAPRLVGQRYIDVGTGAGLPGVPLAIVFPERDFHLLDSNGKKTRFLFQVKTALGLDNMTVHHARVQDFHPKLLFEGVLSRAFASLADMVRDCRHLLAENGRFLAMKGRRPEAELAEIRGLCKVLACHRLAVPGLDEQRHLVELALERGQGV